MRIPSGFRADSVRTPEASRAGALHLYIYATPHHARSVGHLALFTTEGATCEAPAFGAVASREAVR
jgi:hypothetical protein